MATKQITSHNQTPKELTPEELNAKIALTGNLADLTPAQQMSYYERYCKHLGLDPITRPFDLLTTFDDQGVPKTVLYANASCSAQLADKRGICYSKPEKEYDQILGVLTIRVEAFKKLENGEFRGRWASGVAHIDGMKGKRLENAIKKAETQAHRRATLAFCGVAMPDESEIEDIAGAVTAPVQVNAAMGGIYDKIGELLRSKNLEDSSGARRYILDGLVSGAYQGISQMTGIPVEIIQDLARQVELKAMKSGLATDAAFTEQEQRQRQRDYAPSGLRARNSYPADPTLPPILTIEESPAEPVKTADPVPALTPTLTAAQQMVSDAVMSLIKEHKKDKAAVLVIVGNCIGREVKRSADLTDEEAERIFKYLQAWGAELSADAKVEPVKYTSTVRAHDVIVGGEMDALIKKLTVLGVSASEISKLISDHIAGEAFGRVIANRFELDNEEALAVNELLQKRIGEIECEKAVAADEV